MQGIAQHNYQIGTVYWPRWQCGFKQDGNVGWNDYKEGKSPFFKSRHFVLLTTYMLHTSHTTLSVFSFTITNEWCSLAAISKTSGKLLRLIWNKNALSLSWRLYSDLLYLGFLLPGIWLLMTLPGFACTSYTWGCLQWILCGFSGLFNYFLFC